MTYISQTFGDYGTEVARGAISGATVMSAMGEMENIDPLVQGRDIWRGNDLSATPSAPASTDIIPTPDSGGEQMTVISEDAADTSAGTGVQTLQLDYLDASGDQQSETITMNGTTGVNTVATDIRFINDMYSLTVGSNGVAEGNIRIYKQSDDTLVYNMIYIGGNKSLVPHRMVPAGKTLVLKGWAAGEAKNKRMVFRIRSTDMNNVLIPGVFCFKDNIYVKQGNWGGVLNIPVPELSIIKISGWADETDCEGSCSWWGYLIDN